MNPSFVATTMSAIHGVVAVLKPAGMPSFHVVAAVRRILSGRLVECLAHAHQLEHAGSKCKVGHGGTLDKDAEGVMVIGLGSACRHLDQYLKGDKEYVAEGLIGIATDTFDSSGKVCSWLLCRITR